METTNIQPSEKSAKEKKIDDWLPITSSRNAKWWYSAFHNVTAMVGAGVLSLPYAMSQLGWGPGIAVLVMSWIITLYTLWQMVEMHEIVPGKRFDRYHELGQHAFGEKLGLYIVVPQQLIVEIGTCIVYMVTGGKSLRKVHETLCPDCKPIRTTFWIMIFASIHFFLCLLPNFNSISGVSLVAAVMSLTYSTIAWTASLKKGVHEHVDYSPRGKTTNDHVFNFFSALGDVAFSYAGHNVVLEIQATIPSTPEKPSKGPMWKGVVVAYIIVAICYFPVAFVGFYIFGSTVDDNILITLEKPSWLVAAANLFVVIHVIGGFQIFAMPVFDMIETYMVKEKKCPPSNVLRFTIRAIYIGLTMFVGISIPFFGGLLGFFGGFALAPTSYYLPCIIWLAVYKPKTFSLSWCANWGDSHTIRGYGNTVAREWYAELPDAVRQIVDRAGFGAFCRGLSRLSTCRPLLAALAERWWDTTDSFHFSAAGDMTMTPYDFSALTGIGVGGDPIPFDTDMDEWEAAQIYLLGELPPLARPGFVRYSWFEVQFRVQPALEEEAPMTEEAVERYARGFLMFLFGTTIFADRANTVPLCLLSALVDVRHILHYDWGGAALATLYGYMSSASRGSGQLLGGYWRAWELWAYAYFPRLAPVPVAETPLVVPFSRRFDGRCVRRPRESFIFFRRRFDTITPAEITWQPWAPLPAVIRDRFAGAIETSRYRILLEGPVCRAWYLGERFLRQTLGLPEQIVPVHPPEHMRDTERFTHGQMVDYTIGWDAGGYRGEGDYSEYVRLFIMRPLSGGRRVGGQRPAAPVAGAGPSRRDRVRGRGGVQRGRGTGWPVLPTTMTYRGRGGATYQIPFAPPPADHELVGFHDLPPASSEYTRQSLELNASMMGMLQRSFDLLALYSIPPPFQIPPVGDAPARPSISTRDGRVYPRTKAGRTDIASSSRAPVPGDDDDEEEESEAEAESSEEETGDGSNSGSDSDAPGDAPGLLPRKRARTDPQASGH